MQNAIHHTCRKNIKEVMATEVRFLNMLQRQNDQEFFTANHLCTDCIADHLCTTLYCKPSMCWLRTADHLCTDSLLQTIYALLCIADHLCADSVLQTIYILYWRQASQLSYKTKAITSTFQMMLPIIYSFALNFFF